MSFFDSLRLAIALGLTLFLVLLRFDAERITRSDYFRYRTPWMGPVSYYILVIAFAVGIAVILPSGREQLFLTGGDPDEMLPVMLLFTAIALLNGVALAFLRYGGILPLPIELLPTRVLGAAANAISEELQFRSIVLGLLIFAGVSRVWRSASRRWSTASSNGVCGESATGISWSARCSSVGRQAWQPCRPARSSLPSWATSPSP